MLHVGLPAGLLTFLAVRLCAEPPHWLLAILIAVPIAFWTVVAALIGYLLPIEAVEPFLWFMAA